MLLLQDAMRTHGKTCRPLCFNLNFLYPVACDDECGGVLLNDMDHVGDAIVSVNLSGIIPVPYRILSNLENTTKYLRVGTRNREMDKNMCHGEVKTWPDSRGHFLCPCAA